MHTLFVIYSGDLVATLASGSTSTVVKSFSDILDQGIPIMTVKGTNMEQRLAGAPDSSAMSKVYKVCKVLIL